MRGIASATTPIDLFNWLSRVQRASLRLVAAAHCQCMAQLHIHGSPEDAFLLVWLHATQPGPAARLLIDQTGSFHSKKRGPGPFNHQLYQSRGEVRKLGGGSDATSCVATPALASHFVTDTVGD